VGAGAHEEQAMTAGIAARLTRPLIDAWAAVRQVVALFVRGFAADLREIRADPSGRNIMKPRGERVERPSDDPV
jgi:hypothetical protein